MEDILSLKNIEIQEFDFNDVTKLIESAVTHALSLKVNVSISIFDRYGREVGFYRMPQSPFSSDAVARGKAYAAFCFKTDTAVLEKKIPFEKIMQLVAVNEKPIVIIEGGKPIFSSDFFLGAIGISGASSVQDDEIAQAALTNFHS
jgi:uncharacterized protein GlcG (DUF336 family)